MKILAKDGKALVTSGKAIIPPTVGGTVNVSYDTIEPTGTNAPRLTGSNDGTAAFVKADTQATYVPVSVGAPTSVNHATTKEYVDGKTGAIQASAILKSGGTMVGKLKLTAEPTEDNDAVDKAYVDAILPAFTADDNDKVLGIVNGALAWVAKA